MGDENRIRSFKNKGKNTDEMRRRRIGETVELRKARKDDQLLKRRNISVAEEPTSPLQDNNLPSPVSMSSEEILSGIMSSDEEEQLRATRACRKILSRERNPPIDHMIRCGVVPRCVEFLTHFNNPSLQFEACWALTNIASGTSEQTQAVVAEGAIPKLQALLSSPRIDVAEQAVWAIGNIAGDGPKTRDLVLQCGVLTDLLRLIKPDSSVSLLRNTVWAISNLCRNKNPPPDFDTVRPALPTLAKLLHFNDKEVLADTCWALSYLTDGTNEKIQAVLDTGLISRLVQLLYSEEFTVLTPALRAVGNIVTGNDSQTDMVINAGALEVLGRLLSHQRLNIVKEAAWTVSNITAGNSEQTQRVLDAGVMKPLLEVLQTGDFKSQKEAAWAVTNYTSGGTIEQLAKLVEMGTLKPLCNLLNAKDWKTVSVVLDGLANILNAANRLGEVEKVAIMIEECGGLDSLEALQAHDNENVYEKALSLIENYFSENAPDESVPAPQTADGQLQFNPQINSNLPNGGFSF
ncbi:importin subunit alpha-5 isoform X1 [Agrilus planipennis]|uniref:Importin subunit alpha n=2 Tax=Agrilus planipennis TaxID=224129 RepID=A0A7F5QW77_AGRPL|nr:importin subunit alpha-5 isoform X1 [Agrilus planipennis]